MQGYMPIFMQTHQPAQEQTQSVLQPAPVDPNIKKIKDAKANVEKYQKRLKCTSGTLILLGCVGLAGSIYWQFNAARAADKMIHWHPHHNATAGPRPEESKFVTKEEFELYDALKTMCAISFFLFAKLIALGKCGKRIAWKNKVQKTHKLGKKSCLCLLLLIFTTILMWREGKHIGHIMKKVHHKPHHKSEPVPMEFDEPDYPLMDGRHLQEEISAPMTFVDKKIPTILKDVEDTCFAHKDESSCNADGPCSWCDAAAVKPACHSIENARGLPPAVFSCSKLNETIEEPEIMIEESLPPLAIEDPVKDVEDTCFAHKDESSCNNDGPCSWCDAAAVKPACHSIENARGLPPAVF